MVFSSWRFFVSLVTNGADSVDAPQTARLFSISSKPPRSTDRSNEIKIGADHKSDSSKNKKSWNFEKSIQNPMDFQTCFTPI